MKQVQLIALCGKFWAESERICAAFLVSRGLLLGEPDQDVPRLSAEMAVVRLHDAWARFCRSVVIYSACGGSYTAGGLCLPRVAGISSFPDVIPTLLSRYPNRRYEPRWADATECIDAGSRLGIKNLGTVAAALGSVTSPADDLRVVRNFFAHRHESTARDIRAKSWYRAKTPLTVEHLVASFTGGVTAMESWIFDLRTVAEAAVQ